MVAVQRIGPEDGFLRNINKIQERVKSLETKPAGNIVVRETIRTTDPVTGVDTILGELPDGSYGIQPFINDTTPPPVPTTPIVVTQSGTVIATWDGNFVAGALAPRDFQFCYIYGKRQSDNVIALLGSVTNTNDSAISGADMVTGGEVWTFWATSVDYNGNESAASVTTAPITIASVLDDTGLASALANNQTQINAANAAIATKNTVFTQATAPTANRVNDTWFDTSNGNKPMTWNGTAWVSAQDASIATAQSAAVSAQNTANTKTKTFTQGTTPTATTVGDIWIDTANGNVIKIWDGSTWVNRADAAIAAAQAAASAAQTSANGKNTNISAASAPATAGHINGDLWFDTSNGNKPMVFSGSSWVSAQDAAIATAQSAANTAQTTANGKNTAFYQSTSPSTSGRVTGDLWFDTGNGYRLSVWNGSAWTLSQDASIAAAQTTANTKTKTFIQGTTPTATTVGDIWIDTSNGNVIKTWEGSSWINRADAAIAAAQTTANSAQTSANGKNTVFYQTTAPSTSGRVTGDTWFDTANGYRISVWNGSAWTLSQDASIATAQTAANAAQTTANSKTKTFVAASAPSATTVGDIWIDTANGNVIKIWDGSTWVNRADAAIAAAQSAATAAQTSANGKNTIISAASSPATAGHINGDIWFDTSNGNKPMVFSGTTWVSAQDASIATAQSAANTAQTTANGKNTIISAASAPATAGHINGDVWFDTSNGNKPMVFAGTAWVTAQDASIATAQTTANTANTTANSKTKTFIQSATPTATTVGDIWIDTGNGNVIKTWEGASWVTRADASIAAAQTAANTAQTTANGKNTVVSAASAPATAGHINGDIWFDTSNGNKPMVFSTNTWVSAQDASIATAQSAATAAQTTANGKNTIISAASAPATAGHINGDVWFDTSNGNKPMVLSGTAWVSAQDASIATAQTSANNALTSANGKNTIISAASAPATAGHINGDMWFDTSNGNKPMVLSGTAWVSAQDASIATAQSAAVAAQTTANSKTKTFIQGTTPTATTVGDIWIDTANGNVVKTWEGASWVNRADAAIAAAQTAANTAQTTANGKNTVVSAASAPATAGHINGDIWFDTSNGNKPMVFSTNTWVSAQDASIATAQSAANAAQTTANGRNTIISAGSAPATAGHINGDVWFDTSNGNKPMILSGTSWVSAQDASIAAAQTAANTAQTTANGKNTVVSAASAPATAGHINGDIWFDTSNGNKPMVFSTNTWVSAQDASIATAQTAAVAAQTTANSKTKTFIQGTTPTATTVGDIWIDTSNGNVIKTWEGSSWITRADAAIAAAQAAANTAQTSANGKNTIVSAASAPATAGHINGDVWFDTSNGNKPMVFSTNTWVSAQDASIATAQTAANTAQTTANGKNTATYSASAATGSGTRAGDIWFQTNGSNIIIGQWQWSGSAWIQQTIDNAVIANLDAGKITAGYIAAARIQASTISTDKLSIGDFTNLCDDPDFEQGGVGWQISGQASLASTTGVEGASTNALKMIANTTTIDSLNRNIIPVQAGDRIYGQIYVKQDGAGTTGNLHFATTVKMADGTLQYPLFQQVTCSTVTTSWSLLSGVITVPANAVSLQPRVSVRNDATNGTFYFDHAVVRRQVNATTIQDGVITTTKIAADTITAGNIAAGAITASELAAGSVQASHLTANSVSATAMVANTITAGQIAAGTITAAQIAAGTITATQIATDTITAGNIAAGAITASELAAGSVQASHLTANSVSATAMVANTITAGQIAAGTITATQIAAGTITATQIATDTITAGQIAAGAITASELAAGSVQANHLTANSVSATAMVANTITAGQIASGTITAGQIAAGTITATQIATDTITAGNIAAGAVTASELAAGSVQANHLTANSVSATAMVANTVTAGQIAAGTITATQIAAGTITATQIATDTITAGNIAAGAITASELAAGSVQASHLTANSVSATAMVANTITAGQIASGTITAGQIAAGTITATQIATDTITAGNIAAGAITASELAAGSVQATHMTANSVAASAMVANTITAGQIAAGTITATQIAANTITASQIAADTITAAQIAADSITSSELAAGSITAAKGQISDLAVTTAKINDAAITTAKIANLAVTNAQIADATIQSAKIGSVDAGTITVGTLSAARIAAGSITADKVLLADITNYIENPDFEGDTIGQQARGYVANGNTSVVDISSLGGTFGVMGTAGNGTGKAVAINALNGSNNDLYALDLIPVKTGDQFYVEYEARNLNTVGAGGGGLGFRTYGPTKTAITWTTVAAYGSSKSTTWSKKTGTYTVPSGTAYLQIWLSFANNAETTNQLWFDNLVVRRKNGAELIVDGAIQAGSAIIANGAIGTAQIADANITTAKINDAAITNAKINDLDASKITAGYISAGRINAGTITGTMIAGTTITAANIATDTITAGQIAAGAITASELAAGSVQASHLTANSVSATAILANTITASQIAAGTITASQVAANTITAGQIAANTITATQIAANTITAGQIAANTITAGQIAANTITASQIAAGTITASQMLAGTITAASGIIGDINADKITSGTINASYIAVGSGTNALSDPGFNSTPLTTARTAQSTGGTGGWTIAAGTSTGLRKATRTTASTSDVFSYLTMPHTYANAGQLIPAVAGQVWTLKCDTTTSVSAANVTFQAYTASADGTVATTAITTVSANSTSQRPVTATYTVPAGVTGFMIGLKCDTAGVTWTVHGNAYVGQQVTGDLLVNGAINGQTITGATVQTAASGPRIVLDQSSLNAWNTAGDNYFSVADATGVNISSLGQAGYDVTRTNWCTNPSMETDISGWTTGAQTIIRDTAQSYVGAASVKATHNATADRTLSYTLYNGSSTSGHVLSAYVRHNAATSKNMHASIYYVDGSNVTVSAGAFVGSDVSVPPNTWTRVSVTTAWRSSYNYRLDIVGTAFTSADSMWVDAVLVERGTSSVNSYFDGTTAQSGNTYYAWTGTAHLTTSEERLLRNVKIKTGGNNVLNGPAGITQSPGVGFIPPTPYLQTAGLFSDGQAVTLNEGGSDPSQRAYLQVGNQQLTTYSWGSTQMTSRSSISLTAQNGQLQLTGTGSSGIALSNGGGSGLITANGREIGYASYVEWINSQTGVPNNSVWGIGTPTQYSRTTNSTMTSAPGGDNILFNVSGIYVISFLLNIGVGATGRTFCGFGQSYSIYQTARNSMVVGEDTVSAVATTRVNAGETVNFNYFQTTGGTVTATTKVRITRISDI